MEFERSRKIKMHFDIAPLIDIVFLLLIFFMLTANFILQPGIKVTLPAAENSQPQEDQKISIFISESDEIYLDDLKVAIDDLEGILKDKLETVTDKTVVIRADEKIDLGLAVRIMDIAKGAGSSNVVIATDSDPDKTGRNKDQERPE